MTLGCQEKLLMFWNQVRADCHSSPFAQVQIVVLKTIKSVYTTDWGILSNNSSALAHLFALSHALMHAPMAVTVAYNAVVYIYFNRDIAISHCSPFSQLLIAALKLISLTSIINFKAFSHYSPFEQELTEALQLKWLLLFVSICICSSMNKALSHLWPLPQALTLMVKLISSSSD
eukprot:gnl/MRDRNA2_/MRDRNA2_256756_c0_seq1.p1 gnl/MRDRNA2_/MRDRNA2_256756_c0~~gnl/MRDRNA2_/MRDRNA2_256756_c0_seq1.p1  ORF type:complete len:175 (-),score=15.40 gnl/MRDRNA2_/MRDRNA2_256756_c0_seq1:44-568(-)